MSQLSASVVVVTYNSSNTVLETLDSIYDQTYSDIELIVSDDCSRDDTAIIVSQWLTDHSSRFTSTCFTHTDNNSGVTKNCNHGISMAKGKYVQLIAGDDIMLPTLLEDKIKFAEEHSLNYVVSMTEPFGDDPDMVKKMEQFCNNGYDIIRQGYKKQLDSILFSNYIAGPSGSFYLREFFNDFGGYDERYPMLEDHPFIYHYLMAGYEITLLEKTLTRYRINGASLCTSSASPMWKSQSDFFFKERFWQLIKRGKIGKALYKTTTLSIRRTVKFFIDLKRALIKN